MAKVAFLLAVLLLSAASPARSVAFTDQLDGAEAVENFRTIHNNARPGFSGYHDVWSNGNTFTTDLKVQVSGQQAWPQIREGVTSGLSSNVFTPGYPTTVGNYLNLPGNRYISYIGSWSRRTNGPDPKNSATGNRYNGAYIWLNEQNNYIDNTFPIFPFEVEINIWNRHDLGIPSGTQNIGTYFDSNGAYAVSQGTVNDPGTGKPFTAYYFLLNKNQETASMVINTKALLNFLVQRGLNNQLDIVGMYIAAEGHGPGNNRPGADGKFMAVISTMGRP